MIGVSPCVICQGLVAFPGHIDLLHQKSKKWKSYQLAVHRKENFKPNIYLHQLNIPYAKFGLSSLGCCISQI